MPSLQNVVCCCSVRLAIIIALHSELYLSIQTDIEAGVCLMHRIESEAGLISSYVHTSPAPGLGCMAALVALETSTASLTEEQQAEAKVGSNAAYAVIF